MLARPENGWCYWCSHGSIEFKSKLEDRELESIGSKSICQLSAILIRHLTRRDFLIKSIKVSKLPAVPYLESTSLISHNNGEVNLSTSKVNVLIGKNGAGKSALLKALALLTLSYFTGKSSINDEYLENEYWEKESDKWFADTKFLKGLSIEGTLGIARYYKPLLIPGDESSLTVSMMTGYSKEAREMLPLISAKSSGESRSNLLSALLREVTESRLLTDILTANSRYAVDQLIDPSSIKGVWRAKDYLKLYEHLLGMDSSYNLILLDEPEQSLDLVEEIKLWKKLESIDTSKFQVIISSHSHYPILNPDKFNLVECSPGHLKACLEL